jgi:alpha-L-rhamnosidase
VADPGAGSEQDLAKEENLLWDSGTVTGDESVLIPYEGETLFPRNIYYWRVKVTTNQGETAWSETNHWSMALPDTSGWQAKWIGEDAFSNPGETDKGNTRLAARYLRKPFDSKRQIIRAVLYISGQGTYKAYINGERVRMMSLPPQFHGISEKVYYNVYDVTSMIRRNNNVLGVKLGNGRYFGMRESPTQVFGLPRLLAQLEIEYSDGSTDVIVSDESWKVTSQGPIIANNEFDGEEYDARNELPGWDKVDYDDTLWKQADIMAAPGGTLTAQPNRTSVYRTNWHR